MAEDGRDHRPAVPASPPRHRSQRTACRTTRRRHCCRVRRHGSRPGAWCHQAQTLPDPTPPCEDDFNILHRRCRPSGIIIAPPFPAQHGRPRPAPLLVNSPRILTRAAFSAPRPQDAHHGQTAYDPTLRVGRVVHVVHLNTLPMSTTLPDRPCRIESVVVISDAVRFDFGVPCVPVFHDARLGPTRVAPPSTPRI